MYRRSKKRGSLSLSINAIVVLVLAIAMLGLGLSFTKKMFGKFGDTLDVPEPELFATEDDPIVLTSDVIDIKYSKAVSIPIRYYSAGSREVVPVFSCVTGPSTKGAPMTLGNGEQKTFRILLPKQFLESESDICNLAMKSPDESQMYSSKQITLNNIGWVASS